MKEKIDAILEAGEMFLNAPDDLAEFIDKPAIKRSRTDQILALICEEIEKANNPFMKFATPDLNQGFECCRQDILAMLQRKKEAQEPVLDGIGPKGRHPDWRNRVLRKEDK